MAVRTVPGWVMVDEPDPDAPATECGTCGFDAVVRFPLYVVSLAGVTPFGNFPACVRCWDEKQREES